MGGELRLGDVTTTGRRRRIRTLLFALATLPGALALALLPFAGHSRGDDFVDTLTAASNIPLGMAIFIEVALVIAWRGRLWRTAILMPIAALAALFSGLVTVFHGSTQIRPVSNAAEELVATAFLISALLCGVVFVAEWILVTSEHKLPPDDLPPARVISR